MRKYRAVLAVSRPSKSGSRASGSWVRIPPCPPAKNRWIQRIHRFLFIYGYSFIFNIFSRQQKYISNLLSVKTSCIFLFPVQSRRQHFHLPKPHPVYQALQLDKRGAIHIYGGLQKRSGQTDFIYSFELVARKRYSIISLLDLWGRFETQNYITVNILRRLDAYGVFHFV